MTLKPSKRSNVAPFVAMDVFARAQAMEDEGQSIIHWNVGQPSTGLPREAARNLIDMMAKDPMGYTEARGQKKVRDAISEHYTSHYGVTIDPARIVMTMGSSGAFILTFLAGFDPGDRIALSVPAYPPYIQMITSLGLKPMPIAVGAKDRFQPTLDQLSSLNPKPDGLLLASPANPTGTSLPRERFESLMSYCRENEIRVISDEIYHGLEYNGRAQTAAAFNESAVVINGFSKYFCMTGWRLGWMVAPEDLVRPIERLGQSLFIAAPTPAQVAAVNVFECHEELKANVARYDANRAALLQALPSLGFGELAPPDGAFYLYAEIGSLGQDSVTLCEKILSETGVSMTPGVDFDPLNGQRYIRISYAGSTEGIHEGIARLTDWISTRV